MPPKKEKKKAKTPPEKQYILLSLEEIKIRELKYTNRLMELSKCLSFIDDAIQQMSAFNEQQVLQDKWLDFVTCNPLPKPHLPPDIRFFYSKLKYWENESKENSINWLLSVNERSLLTQDIYRKDLTRRKLSVELKENIGEEYNGYIKDSIRILHRIEYFLDNDTELADCSLNILHDIVTRKLAIQEEIMDFMDRYTYRIISSEEAQMKSLDAISAEYYYNADNFRIHIWCLKRVALRIEHLSEPRLLANFHSINLLLHIPMTMLRENLVIRALHMDFDNLSERCKSFNQTITVSTDTLSAGIVDLQECLAQEWIMQLEVQNRKRNEMIQARMKYEEQLRQYQEQMEKKKGRNKEEEKGTKKKAKVAKPTKEPPFLANDMYPDTYEEFLEEDQKQYEHFIQTVYNPELLNLSTDEINLKKYFILGGIYQLYYVEKPIHFELNSFNMTWHVNQGQLVVDKNVSIPNASDPTSKRLTRRLTKRMTVMEADMLNADTDVESPWFIVTIQLPEYLCYWGEPIACHFETIAEQKQKKVEEIQEQPIEIEKTKKNLPKAKTEQQPPIVLKPPSILLNPTTENRSESVFQPDFSHELTATASFISKRIRSAASQRISHASFFRRSLANELLQSNSPEETIWDSARALQVIDFPITSHNLTQPQIRHLERHILPRIISSYKFPKEIRQEEMEIYNKKPKGKGGKIIRKKTSDTQLKLSNRQFTFTNLQNKPERIFATYPKVEPLTIVSHLRDANLNNDQEEPETFAQLLQIISNIKKKYSLRISQILDLKPLETEIISKNKRIKQMQRKKELLAMTSKITITRSTVNIPRNTKDSVEKSLKDVRKTKQSIMEKQTVEPENLVEPEDTKNNYSVEENLLLKDSSSEIDIKEKKEEDDTSTSCTYSHWTTKYILKTDYDRENHKIILHTNRLGNFGFAFNRYEHFPFKYWKMEPSKTDPENEVIFTLDTQYVRCVLNITADGIRGHVTEPSKTYIRNPKIYLVIEKPINDYKEFKQLFKAKHLNIFAEPDAIFYIENGYFSEKHLANEMHTYCCMAVHSTQMKFNFSQWNRLAKRRDIILHFQQYKDLAENLVEVRLTPGEAYFVEIQELCSDDLNVIKLDYNLTWRNIESYSDLHHLIVAMYPAATELRCMNPKLICCIKDLLSEIRPLSFS